ncbi:MAG TPA: substrate-binding domain-containing protein [Longimicrobiales bacterium]
MRDHQQTLRIACTIGPVESGLLPELERRFTARSGTPVEHEALGSGAALERARAGGIDLVIAHAPALEERFVAEGFATTRQPFAASTFVLAGPPADPAGVRGLAEVGLALRRIADQGAPFLSRGDRSGTHLKELELWQEAGADPAGDWYRVSAVGARGSAAVAREAARTGAYTLIDWASLIVAWPSLVPLTTGDPRLLNIFSALPVDPARIVDVRADASAAFLRWLLDAEAQGIIADFGRADYGVPLFVALDQLAAQKHHSMPQPPVPPG